MSPCPYCGTVPDETIHSGGNENIKSRPGNWSICWDCCHARIYDSQLRPRKPTKQEIENIPEQVIEAIKHVISIKLL